jgi:hypothetical protein
MLDQLLLEEAGAFVNDFPKEKNKSRSKSKKQTGLSFKIVATQGGSPDPKNQSSMSGKVRDTSLGSSFADVLSQDHHRPLNNTALLMHQHRNQSEQQELLMNRIAKITVELKAYDIIAPLGLPIGSDPILATH